MQTWLLGVVLCGACSGSQPEQPVAEVVKALPSVSENLVDKKSDWLEINLRLPEVHGVGTAEADRALSARLAQPTDEAIAALTAEHASEAALPDNLRSPEQRKASVYAVYKVHRASAEWLSLTLDVSTYTGGAHPNTRRYGYAIDVPTGKIVDIDNLFKPGSGWEDKVSALIHQGLAAKGGDIFPEAAAAVDILSPIRAWYLTDTAIVFVFQSYEVAPYSSGLPEVALPFADIASLLRAPL